MIRELPVLQNLCAGMVDHFSGFMPPLDTVPRVLVDPDLDCDGLSLPREIRLNPRMLAASPEFMSLTLAHEVAHQWWGAYGQQTLFPNEGMSELMAYQWLSVAHGAAAERDAAQIARGKMFHGFLRLGTVMYEAEVMGRQVLVLRDAHRLFGPRFWAAVRRVYAGQTASAAWVSTLLDTLQVACTLPVPALVDGCIVDADTTGQFAAIDLRGPAGQTEAAPFGTRCGEGWRLAGEQTGAVMNDHYEKDIARYISAITKPG